MSVHCEDCGLPIRGVCCSNCNEETYIDYHQNDGLHPDDQKTVDEVNRLAQEDEYARSEQERQEMEDRFYEANPHEGGN